MFKKCGLVFKNRTSKICGRKPLRIWRVSSTNFTWSILEYFVSFYKVKSKNKILPKSIKINDDYFFFFLNSFANWIQIFVALKRMKEVHNCFKWPISGLLIFQIDTRAKFWVEKLSRTCLKKIYTNGNTVVTLPSASFSTWPVLFTFTWTLPWTMRGFCCCNFNPSIVSTWRASPMWVLQINCVFQPGKLLEEFERLLTNNWFHLYFTT